MKHNRQRSAVSGQPSAVIGEQGLAIHIPVMLREVMDHLMLRPGDDAIDCTFGGGGYTRALLAAIAPVGRVLAIDRDPTAIAAGKRLDWSREERARATFVHGSFGDLKRIAEREGFPAPRAIVADLGFSSLQLNAPQRGFSFTHDGPLDMRFDPTSAVPTAADIITHSTAGELERLFRLYGEEPQARRIAQAIVAERSRRSLETTGALADLIARAVRGRGRIHPATRIFQALRIAVNDELSELEKGIPQMLDLIAPAGRVAIISFHSLEDRLVKRFFRRAAKSGWGTIITRRPIRPGAAEIASNPRSRSAKLRVIKRQP